jgi:hypothetical protein
MGGFLYLRKTPGMQLAPARATLEDQDFALFLFPKRFAKSEQLLRLPDGDFIAAVGTLFYKGRMGGLALRALHADFGGPGDLFSDLCGQFAVLLRKNGVLSCFNDFFGNYHVYSDERASVVSSSFLAVVQRLKEVELSPQALYEYVFDAATYGAETLVRGVTRLDHSRIHELPGRSHPKGCRLAQCEPPARFDEQVDAANADLLAYFGMLGEHFGDAVLIGLSGGYDSRLLLAAALKAGIRPRLFVGGGADSCDVRVAKALAAGAGLALEHFDTASLPTPAPEGFGAIVEEKFEHYDGAGIRGAINDGEEYVWRLRRMAGHCLELNGGGGEIYRDFWKIPNRRIAVGDFVAKTLEFKNLDKIAAATARFDRGRYREALTEKLKCLLKTEVLTWEQVAYLYTILRSTYFAGPTNKELNGLGHSLLPFVEPKLAFPSYGIALRHKMYGRFESEMIRRLHPGLAAYPSSYGHRFSDRPPVARRVRESAERHCRSLLPLPLVFAAYRMLRKKNQYNSSPYYYAEHYLRNIVDLKSPLVAEYFDLEKLRTLDDPYVLSRLLTVELLLTSRRDAAALPRAA